MKVELVSTVEDFKFLREQWDNVLAASSSKSIFLSWEWLYYWWIAFGGTKELYILLIRESSSNNLIGIVPFFRELRSFVGVIKIKVLRFLGAGKGAADFLDLILMSGHEERCLQAVLDFLRFNRDTWDYVECAELEQGSTKTILYLRNISNTEFLSFELPSQHCPYLELPDTFDKLSETVSSKLLKNLRWAEKQLTTKLGAVFTANDGQTSIKEKMHTLFELHQTRFSQKKDDVSSFVGDQIKKFNLAVAADLNNAGRFRFYAIKIGGQTIACLYAFRYKDRFFYYQTGYNTDFSKYSAGMVVLSFAIKSAIEEGASEFHFLRGEEPYKLRWTGDEKLTKRLYVFKRNVPGFLISSLLRARCTLSSVKKKISKRQKDEE